MSRFTRSEYSNTNNFFGSQNCFELIKKYGSPLYVYNENILRMRCREIKELVDLPSFQIYYSSKANANPHLLKIIRSEGLFADAMSPGELAMLHRAGFSKAEIAYVCNNVDSEELLLAATSASIVSVDSLSQLELLGHAAPNARVMVRLNPGIGAGHNKKVVTAGSETKFGINPEYLPEIHKICEKFKLKLVGINQHVGSLFMETEPFILAAARLLELAEEFKDLEVIDFGGGFGIPYHKYAQEKPLNMQELGDNLTNLLSGWSARHKYKGKFNIEPGRYIVAESGLLLTRVLAVKNNADVRYVCTDAGFNILPRPVIYDAFHDLEIYQPAEFTAPDNEFSQTVVGNICESGDIIASKRVLPEIRTGELLGILDAGAYCYSMSSNYNQRLRPAEVLIDLAGSVHLIRRRETTEDLFRTIPE